MKKIITTITLSLVFSNASAKTKMQHCETLLGAGIYNAFLEKYCGFQGGVHSFINNLYKDGGCRSIVPQRTVNKFMDDVFDDSEARYKAMGHIAFCDGNKKAYFDLVPNSVQTPVPPRFRKGESYAGVRLKMIKAGWDPYHSKNADKCWGGDLRCTGRPEMHSCSGTGFALCEFLWKKNNKIISIITYGEERPAFKSWGLFKSRD